MTKLSVKTIKFFRNSKLYLANTQERIFTRQERICTRGGKRGLISSSLLFWVLLTMLSCHPGAAGSSVSPAGPSSASASQEPTIASQEDHVKKSINDEKNAKTLECYYEVIQENLLSSSGDTEKVNWVVAHTEVIAVL